MSDGITTLRARAHRSKNGLTSRQTGTSCGSIIKFTQDDGATEPTNGDDGQTQPGDGGTGGDGGGLGRTALIGGLALLVALIGLGGS